MGTFPFLNSGKELFGWFIVTPDMHRIHHSGKRKEADSNYGFSVSVWDRLFSAYASDPQNNHLTMDIGIKGLHVPLELDFIKILLMPFLK